jgi:site-specific DNA recombinase
VSKARADKYARRTGGRPLARGALYLMLQNRIYRGEIVHKNNSYLGEHEPIVDEKLWDEVQRKLAANRFDRATGAGATRLSLLAGLIYDDAGARMTPTHANKKGTRYRYYVSPGLVRGTRRQAPRGRRVPADDLERLVEERLRQFLHSNAEVYGAIEPLVGDVNDCTEVVGRASALAQRWPGLAPAERRAILATLVDRIDLLRETVEIRICPGRLPAVLRDETGPQELQRKPNADEAIITFTVPARLKRTGTETRLLIDGRGANSRRDPDHSLHRLLARAHRYNDMVMRRDGKTMRQLAAEAGVVRSYFTRILRLSFLAPDLVTAILRDRHPIELSAKRLANELRLPIAWDEQRTLLGSG